MARITKNMYKTEDEDYAISNKGIRRKQQGKGIKIKIMNFELRSGQQVLDINETNKDKNQNKTINAQNKQKYV